MTHTKTLPKQQETHLEPQAGSPQVEVRTLSLTFDLPLHPDDLEAFRGAVASLAGIGNNLFHNHNNAIDAQTPYLFRYPRIQYQMHNGCASLFGINEGADALDGLTRRNAWRNFAVNGRPMPLRVAELRENNNFRLGLLPQPQRYRIYNYLPFTADNYTQYKQLPYLTEKVAMLERLLANHIVGFGRQVGWQWGDDQRLQVTLNDMDRVKKHNILGTDLMAFDLVFAANATLPDRLGLGRKPAFGCGWIYRLA
jgi:hypothetical protein